MSPSFATFLLGGLVGAGIASGWWGATRLRDSTNAAILRIFVGIASGILALITLGHVITAAAGVE